MKHQIRHFVKQIPGTKFLYSNLMHALYSIKAGTWRALLKSGQRNIGWDYKYLTWQTGLPDLKSAEELETWLRNKNIQFSQGSHAFYLPPQPGLNSILGNLVTAYPAGCGFKILKDFKRPTEAHYMGNHDDATGESEVRKLVAGSPVDQMIVANYMHFKGIGPRIYDVCCLKAFEMNYTAFVVEHVSGREPNNEECLDFKSKVQNLLEHSQLRMVISNWAGGGDFKCPGCNGNLLVSTSGDTQNFNYVDFQNFGLTSPKKWTKELLTSKEQNLHFGNSRGWRTEKYLYQSIPDTAEVGKRSTDKRWKLILKSLNNITVKLDGRIVLDVGCNSGMVIHQSLKQGAKWGFGWDLGKNTKIASPLLCSLGSSRHSLFSCNLTDKYAIYRDIEAVSKADLEEAVVFYLAIGHHVGLLEAFKNNAWRAFVFEGAQKQTLAQALDFLDPLIKDGIAVAEQQYISDGDSSKRPYIVLWNKGKKQATS